MSTPKILASLAIDIAFLHAEKASLASATTWSASKPVESIVLLEMDSAGTGKDISFFCKDANLIPKNKSTKTEKNKWIGLLR